MQNMRLEESVTMSRNVNSSDGSAEFRASLRKPSRVSPAAAAG